MPRQTGRVLPILGALLTIAALLTGCGGGGGGQRNARVRYFNALIGVTGNGSVDFLSPRGNTTIRQAGPVAYGGIAPSVGVLLLPLDAGSETFQVTAAGTTSPQLAALTATMTAGTGYLVAVSGIVGQTDARAPRLAILTDNLPAIGSTQAALRLVHLAPDAPPVDLFNTPLNGQPAPITGLTNLAYGNASTYALVPAGNYNLSVRVAGTGTVVPTQSSTSPIGLVGGKAYTIFAIGLVNPGTGQPAFDVRLVADN
ncbi:MAG: DUF4397 domain-containing protein [Chloroherpetonaceae bacterium]|nr:DUF4397 domain-containing protein [Chloroherpetonaceae bacterium]